MSTSTALECVDHPSKILISSRSSLTRKMKGVRCGRLMQMEKVVTSSTEADGETAMVSTDSDEGGGDD